MRLISKNLSIIVSAVVILFIALVIPPTCARNHETAYSTILSGNHSEKLYWTLDNTEDEHTLSCTLQDDAEPEIFEWTYVDGSEINSTDIINITETTEMSRSLRLKFVNITYFIADVFICRAVEWNEELNSTVTNITTVNIFVQESKKLELLIGMSVAAVVFFIISMLLIKFL